MQLKLQQRGKTKLKPKMLQELPITDLKKRKNDENISSGGITVTQTSKDRSRGNLVGNRDLPFKGPMNIDNYYSDKQHESKWYYGKSKTD